VKESPYSISSEAREDELRIAPRGHGKHWTVDDWKELDFDKEAGWQKAIDIFEDRIRFRFLEPARSMDHEGAGFAIMALDCLLIETLQQFFEGVPENRGQSGAYFRCFLTRTRFGDFFSVETADFFYQLIRCGILHQAEIGGSSRLLIRRGTPLVKMAADGKGLIINRRLFHRELVDEFDDYVTRLRENNPPDLELRRRFKRKMDTICRQPSDPMPQLGILAYGSLIDDPGEELAPLIVDRLRCVETPFPVEFARFSTTRDGAPTLVEVAPNKGGKVLAQILLLSPEVKPETARNILYHREIGKVGDQSVPYDEKEQRKKSNPVLIRTTRRAFAGIAHVLYASLKPDPELDQNAKSDDDKAALLADHAIQSVTAKTFPARRDGIAYLADAIKNGIHTPLTKPYCRAVLTKAFGEFPEETMGSVTGMVAALEKARLKLASDSGANGKEEL
jgi:hypothetical protein